MRSIAELCVADVDLSRAPPKGEMPRGRRGSKRGRAWRYTSDEYHRWMLEREG